VAKTGRTGRFVKSPHDDSGYKKRRAQLMATVGPGTRCGRCGKLFHQHPPHKNGSIGRWEVGHVLDAVTHGNLGPLRIEHSVCNRKAGGALGYKRGLGRARTNGTNGTSGPRHVENHFPGHYDLRNPDAPSAAPCLRATRSLCATCAGYLKLNPNHQ
jgi:hypothetical protein